MTCQELHCYLENPLRVEIYIYRESLPAAVLEHLSQCGECERLFEEQKALGIRLQIARDAAPEVPQGLTAKVLESYRQQIQQPESGRRNVWKFSNRWLAWGAAAAVVVAAITIAFLLSPKHSPKAPDKVVSKKEAPATVEPRLVGTSMAPVEVQTTKHEAPVERVRKAATNKSPLPPGFASLMYCDEMSCTGQMEVIRVELPPTTQASGPAASPVMAEVLVGADGIARGIRFVQ